MAGHGCDPDDPQTWTAPVVRIGYRNTRRSSRRSTPRRCTTRTTGSPARAGGSRDRTSERSPSASPTRTTRATPAGTSTRASAPRGLTRPTTSVGASTRAPTARCSCCSCSSPRSATTMLRRVPVRLAPGARSRVESFGEAGADVFELMPLPEGDVAFATGDPGDVYLCHPFLVHAAQPRRGRRPRSWRSRPCTRSGRSTSIAPTATTRRSSRRSDSAARTRSRRLRNVLIVFIVVAALVVFAVAAATVAAPRRLAGQSTPAVLKLDDAVEWTPNGCPSRLPRDQPRRREPDPPVAPGLLRRGGPGVGVRGGAGRRSRADRPRAGRREGRRRRRLRGGPGVGRRTRAHRVCRSCACWICSCATSTRSAPSGRPPRGEARARAAPLKRAGIG